MIRRRALRFAVAFGLLGAPVLTAQTKTLPDSASLTPPKTDTTETQKPIPTATAARRVIRSDYL